MRHSRPLLVGFAVAVLATAGSLWFSLGLGLTPCRLCWYQRILMYPLVVVLGGAVLDGDRTAPRTALPLSLAGTLVAGYHVLVQLSPSAGSCSVSHGCSAVQFAALGGLVTIPRLSLVAFVLVSAAMVAVVSDRWTADG